MVLYEGFPANSCSWQPKENIENTKHLKDFEAKEEKSVQQASKKSKRAEMQQTRANKKEAAAVAIKVEAPEPTREGMQWTAREEAQLRLFVKGNTKRAGVTWLKYFEKLEHKMKRRASALLSKHDRLMKLDRDAEEVELVE
jgi:hypothetical protein